MKGWLPVDAAWWPAIADALPRPWRGRQPLDGLVGVDLEVVVARPQRLHRRADPVGRWR